MGVSLPPYALFLDLECSGSHEDRDVIIEVGCILTSCSPGFEVIEEYSRPVQHPGLDVRSMMDEVVLAMHTRNGLLAEIESGIGATPDLVEQDVLKMIDEHAKDSRVVLAGSGVAHFDRKFIKAEMPQLDHRLVYYSLDIGTTRRLARLAGLSLSPDSGKPHRALPDAQLALAEARVYVEWLSRLVTTDEKRGPDQSLVRRGYSGYSGYTPYGNGRGLWEAWD